MPKQKRLREGPYILLEASWPMSRGASLEPLDLSCSSLFTLIPNNPTSCQGKIRHHHGIKWGPRSPIL